MTILCTQPACQTTAGCQCGGNKPFGVNFTWGHVKDLQTKEIAGLKAEIEALRTELKLQNGFAMSGVLKWAEDLSFEEKANLHAADANIAWAECDALRKELEQAKEALSKIAGGETPWANATVRRLAGIARSALMEERG